MAAEIERIVDRKLIRNRVHYLVVWRGFGDESNTWESRVDLVADGYSSVIRDYEESTKKSRDGSATPTSARSRSRSRSPSRGRSPGRPKGGSSTSSKRSAKSPGTESRGRSRSRSNSVARAKKGAAAASASASVSATGGESSVEPVTAVSTTARRSGRKAKSKEASEPLASAATSQEVPVGAFVVEKQLPTGSDEDTDVLLRSTIQALTTHAASASAEVEAADKLSARKSSPSAVKASPPKAVKTETKTVSLAYEDGGRVVTQTTETVETVAHAHEAATMTTTILTETTTMKAAATATAARELVEDDAALLLLKPRSPATSRRKDGGGFRDMMAKMMERGWLVSFLSVVVVAGSLLASQLLPRSSESEGESDLWRAWLPFLTPVVALLLFFHQKDERASGKWIAIALAWRCTAEVLVLVGTTPVELQSVAGAAAAIANLALLVAVGAIVRNKEHENSKATLVVLVAASFALFLADSWVVVTANPALESRVILMSIAVLGISLSPALTATSDDDE